MAHWDRLSKRYDDMFLEDPAYYDTLERMVAEVDGADDMVLLDLGCGTGNLLSLLLRKFPAAKLIGLDPSPGMREICERRLGDHTNVTLSGGDALNIPFPDASIDCITSSFALHHVPPHLKAACARELARVLKAEGLLVHTDPYCAVPGPPDDPEKSRDIIERIVAKALYSLEHGAREMMLAELTWIPRVLREDGEYLITLREWREVLEEAGFADFKLIDVPPVDLNKIIRCRFKG